MDCVLVQLEICAMSNEWQRAAVRLTEKNVLKELWGRLYTFHLMHSPLLSAKS